MSDDYEVGFGKPPKATRFKAGRSGNPQGRPKGARSLANDLAAELGEQITIREAGRTRRVTKQRALIKSMIAKGLQGDVRSTAAVLATYAKVITDIQDDQNAPMEDEELEILQRYAPRLLKKRATRKRAEVTARLNAHGRRRQAADIVYRQQFVAFVHEAFKTLNGHRLSPNWHIDLLAFHLQKMIAGEFPQRLVLNLPPRSLKSFVVSVCLPAWLLGRDPGAKIMCASYSEDLAYKFSRDCRALMESNFYKRIFSRTRLNPRKSTEGEFETTRRGYRLATSVGGTLTGRGGGVLIVDDPIKANDANSQAALECAKEWFQNTAMSRLDDRSKSLIIVVMQRLHGNDLSGVLIEQEWPSLVLPMVAAEATDYEIGEGEFYHRPAGQLLQPRRDDPSIIDQIVKDAGSRVFQAQYQQEPLPSAGNIFKAAWIRRYETPPPRSAFRDVVQSWDTASKVGSKNDYSVCTTWGIKDNDYYLLDVLRGRWEYSALLNEVIAHAEAHGVTTILVEDASSGTAIIQSVRQNSKLNVIPRKSTIDKEIRAEQQSATFEAGRVYMPKEAPWLAAFELELIAFPAARYDDQVDSAAQFLNWAIERAMYKVPIAMPIIISRPRDFPGCAGWAY